MKCRFEMNENEIDTLLLLFCTILISSPNSNLFFISFLVLPIHAASSHKFTVCLPIIYTFVFDRSIHICTHT